MLRTTFIVCLLCAAAAPAQTVAPRDARAYAEAWLARNPLAVHDRQENGTRRSVRDIERVRLAGGGVPYFLVRLAPRGYILINSDYRLKPVVCFGLAAPPNLEDRPENALYQLLSTQARTNAEWLVDGGAVREEWTWAYAARATVSIAAETDQVVGPLLATSWGQSNHYNEYCPAHADAANGYDGHAPVGCVATAFAQIMKYHAWPYRGVGSTEYTDDQGRLTGTHLADLSDVYEWWRMQKDYYAFGAEPAEAVHAVAELMYELGVAAQTDYEADGSSSSPVVLGSRMREHFLYEPPMHGDDAGSFVTALVDDLDAARPCVASLPGHSVVVDGYMRQFGDVFFHLNYGWSGQNDDWYLLDQIQGQALVEVQTGIQPLLTPINLEAVFGPEGLELRWALPERRAFEVTRTDILERRPVSGTFIDRADAFSTFEVTSTNDVDDWSLVGDGYAGTCYHKPAGGRNRVGYHLTSTGRFRPGPETRLSFRTKYKLIDDVFSLRIITDDGHTNSVVWFVSGANRKSWTEMAIPLGEFAGQDVQIQFEYVYDAGYFNPDGGVWLDEVRVGPAQWYEWEPIHAIEELQAYRAETTVVFTDDADDFDTFAITSTDAYQDWALSPEGHAGLGFHKPAGGYVNVEYHLTSSRSLHIGPQTQLRFDTRYSLYEDEFAVLVSTDGGQTFSPVWSASDEVRENWTEVAVPLEAFAGDDVRIRFAYNIDPGKFYYQSGGVWIDTVRLVNVANAEYADYPVYYTTLTDLPGGTHTLAYQLWSGDQIHPRSTPLTVTWPPANN